MKIDKNSLFLSVKRSFSQQIAPFQKSSQKDEAKRIESLKVEFRERKKFKYRTGKNLEIMLNYSQVTTLHKSSQ